MLLDNQNNWKRNCKYCLHFDKCKSNKTSEECKSFLDKEITKNFLKATKDYVYYVISNDWKILASFTSIDLLEEYIKNHSNFFQIIYRKESVSDGEFTYGPFHIYNIYK